MSVTASNSDPEETYRCSQCDRPQQVSAMVAGSFCSTECHRAHKRERRAREIFRELEQDHRFCATCGRQLKEIERPTRELVIGPSEHDDWEAATDVLVGYQYQTKHATIGERSLDVDDESTALWSDHVVTGTVCQCGNTDHRHEEAAIRLRSPFETAYYLLQATRVLQFEGKHDVQVDTQALFDAVFEQTMPTQPAGGINYRSAFAAAVDLEPR